jgi:hypothetical protein
MYDPPEEQICLSCYMDEARLFISKEIDVLNVLKNGYEDQLEKAQNLVKKDSDDSIRIADKMQMIHNLLKEGRDHIDKVDNIFAKHYNMTQSTIKHYIEIAKKYENEERVSEAVVYFNLASYKNTINNMAMVEYIKERNLMFKLRDDLYEVILELKKLLDKNL